MTFAAAEKGEKGNVYGKEKSAKHRSKTFPDIARAMAEQWGCAKSGEASNSNRTDNVIIGG